MLAKNHGYHGKETHGEVFLSKAEGDSMFSVKSFGYEYIYHKMAWHFKQKVGIYIYIIYIHLRKELCKDCAINHLIFINYHFVHQVMFSLKPRIKINQ